MRHTCIEKCALGHTHSAFQTAFLPFHNITSSGIALAQRYISSSGQTPSLQDYIHSLIPTHPVSHQRDRDWHAGAFLHTKPPRTSCQDPGCNLQPAVTAVDTEWPQTLHITIPEALSLDRRPETTLLFPLTMTLLASNHSSVPSTELSVTYRLVGRIVFHHRRAHYTAQLVIGDRTFDYDSMANSGILGDIGRDALTANPTPSSVLVVYHRTSTAKVCSRSL